MNRNNRIYKRGISVIEYSLIVAVAVAALLGMSVYVKRAISGRWRQAADTFGHGRQYDVKSEQGYNGPLLNLWGK